MELAEKMSKVETLFLELRKGHESQEKKLENLTNLMLGIKQDVGKALGRTEKGDTKVDFNLSANSVDKVDASTTTTQNIKTDGEKT